MNLQVGPQFDLLTGDTEDANVFGISVAAGAEYQISDRFAIVGRYSFGLNNRLDLDGADGEIKMNFFQVGLAFSL
jgi:opacity protein-like surface antigen